MKDCRSKEASNLIFRGRTIMASNSNSEERIADMLKFMNVEASSQIVHQASGYLSMNNMEININNIDTFLKEKGIAKVSDLRKKK